jgi:hypothetical protein
MFEKKAKRFRNIKRFGEICVFTTKNKIQARLSDKGTVCVFVEYSVNNADDVYRLLNPKTKNFIKSSYFLSLNKSYGAWIKSKNDASVIDDSVSEVDNSKDKSETEKPFNDAPNDRKNKRIARAVKQTSK